MINFKYNLPENNAHIENLAYVRALLIKTYIDNLDIEISKKKELYQQILQFLKLHI